MKLKNKVREKLGFPKTNPVFLVEESIVFRVLVTLTVVTGIASTITVAEEEHVLIGFAGIIATIFGSFVSYKLRYSKNIWLKLIISLAMLVTFGDFLRNVAGNPYDPRMPLATLLIWLQVLHSFDLPRRKDLNYSLLVGLILICVTATISRDMIFGLFLLSFIIFALMSLLYNNLSQHNVQKYKIQKKNIARMALPALMVTILGTGVAFLFMPRYQNMKLKALPISMKLPEMPAFKGEITSKAPREVELQMQNGQVTETITRQFNPNAYYGFSTVLDLNFRGRLSDEIVMKVRTSEASYWRGMSFDLYDGKLWTMSKPLDLKKIWARRPKMYVRMSRQVQKDITPKHELVQTFYIEKEMSNLVFASPYAEELYFPSNYVMVDHYGSIRSPVELQEGLTYSVISHVPDFDIDKLRTMGELEDKTGESQKYLQLPPLSERVINLTHEITDGTANKFEKIALLNRYLKTNYPYDLDIPEFPEDKETIDYFLFEQRAGYCEHFATSLAVMARIIGIPTRLVTGYTAGRYNPITAYHEVKSSDAHAWIEVFFPHQGWVPFDPTPGYMADFGANKKMDSFIANTILKEIWQTLLAKIPPYYLSAIKAFIGKVLTAFFNTLKSLMTFFFKLNWFGFIALVASTIFAVLSFVLIRFFATNLKIRKQKEALIRKQFKTADKIAIVKLQDDFIRRLQKSGFAYKSNMTFKEFVDMIAQIRPELNNDLQKLREGIYFVRYGYQEPPDNLLRDLDSLVNRIITACEDLEISKK